MAAALFFAGEPGHRAILKDDCLRPGSSKAVQDIPFGFIGDNICNPGHLLKLQESHSQNAYDRKDNNNNEIFTFHDNPDSSGQIYIFFQSPQIWAMTFPLSGQFRDFHPLEYVRAGRTSRMPTLFRSAFYFKRNFYI